MDVRNMSNLQLDTNYPYVSDGSIILLCQRFNQQNVKLKKIKQTETSSVIVEKINCSYIHRRREVNSSRAKCYVNQFRI